MSAIYFRQILLRSQQCLLILTTLISLPAIAEWSGALQTGYRYANNLGSQRTVEQGLGTSDSVSRSSWVSQGNLGLQSLDPTGGQTLNVFGLFDKSNNKMSDIQELSLSASLFRALNPRWLWRLSGIYERYRDDAVPVSGYDGYGANLTFGYFGQHKQGLDLTLAWKYEDHNKDPLLQYTTNRAWLNLTYYLPHAKDAAIWSVQGQIRHNNASDNFWDYNSYLLGLSIDNWQLGKIQGSAGLQWRKNYYDDPITNTTNTSSSLSALMHNGPGMNMPGGGNGNNGPLYTSQDVNDQLLSALVTFSVSLSKHWRTLLSTDVSRYAVNTNGDTKNYYRIFTGVRWGF